MSVKIEFPEGYALCFVPLALSWLMNTFLVLQVVIGRKRYDVQYPNLYAPAGHKDADKFNCIQRAHQNTLESWSMVMVTMLAVGLVYPVYAAAAGMAWVLGRFVYGLGYALGNPMFRSPGALLSHVGDFPLMGMAFKIAYDVLTDQSTIKLAKGAAKAHLGVEL
uniref:Glutathione transferase n=1 Tax=Zooxanthella nutricula TaxID=1333877 RepID=A0A7S2KV36_9DINO